MTQWLLFTLLWSTQVFALECNDLFKKHPFSSSRVDYQINWDKVVNRIESLSQKYRNELSVRSIGKYDGEDIFRIDIKGRGTGEKKKVVITAGVHGNESVGISTALDLLDQIIYHPQYRQHYDFVIFPALNPGGVKNNVRYLNNSTDLNRTFQTGYEEKITTLLQRDLDGERFDLSLDLHEAYTREGFFVIKSKKNDNGLTKSVMAEIDDELVTHPADHKYPYHIMDVRDPNKVAYTLSGPGESVSYSAGTLKNYFAKDLAVPYSYTIESSGSVEFEQRRETYLQILKSFLDKFQTLP